MVLWFGVIHAHERVSCAENNIEISTSNACMRFTRTNQHQTTGIKKSALKRLYLRLQVCKHPSLIIAYLCFFFVPVLSLVFADAPAVAPCSVLSLRFFQAERLFLWRSPCLSMCRFSLHSDTRKTSCNPCDG